MKKHSLVFALLFCFLCVSITPAQATITIKSAGAYLEYDNENVTRYLDEHPDISLVITNWNYFSTLELTTKLTTGTLEGDLYFLKSDVMDREIIMRKGFCLDLSSSEILTSYLNDMYPYIVEQLTYDGCLYAWPTGITFSYMQIDEDLWKEAGLSGSDIPDTFSEFLDFIEQWCDHLENDDTCGYHIMGGMDGYEEMLKGNDGVYIDWLLKLLIEECITQQQLAGEEKVQFDEENITSLIKRCVNIGRRICQIEKQCCTEGKGFFTVASSSMEWPSSTDVVYLRINDQQPKVIKATLSMVLINPSTEYPEQCIELLEAYAANSWENANKPNDQFFLKKAQPRVKPGWEDDYKRDQSTLEDIQQQLEDDSLDEDSRVALEDKLAIYQEQLQWCETNKWVLSPDKLEDYKNNMGMIFFPTPTVLTDPDGNSQIYKLRQQVSDGAITVDQFIQRLCEISTMIQQEEAN